MNKPYNYKVIGKINPNHIIEFLNDTVIPWTGDFNNLHKRDIVFKDVQSFCIVDDFQIFNLFYDIKPLLLEIFEVLCEQYGEGVISKCHFSKINSKSKVKKHTDNGLIFSLSHRVQIPLITDDSVIFEVGDKKFKTESGKMFEINNLKKHTLKVNSSIERVTMIIDYMEKSIYDKFYDYI